MKQFFSKKGIEISYLEAGTTNHNKIIILPRGTGESLFYRKMLNYFKGKYHIIAIDLPGSGKTKVNSNNPKEIAKDISLFLKIKKIKHPLIIGESFGGNVAIELLNFIECKKVILIGCGNFFSPIEKILLKIIFFPVKKISGLEKSYAKLISFISLNIFKTKELDLRNKNNFQLSLLNNRWNEILNYKLPEYKLDVPALYIICKDNIVSKKSTEKINSIFSKLTITALNCDHFSYQDELSKNNYELISEFLKK